MLEGIKLHFKAITPSMMWDVGIFFGILSVPHNIAMDSNNVMSLQKKLGH